LALAVPLSRFTPRVGGGSAFYVRRLAMRILITISCLLPCLVGIGCAHRFTGEFAFKNSSTRQLDVEVTGLPDNPPVGALVPGGCKTALMNPQRLPAAVTVSWSEVPDYSRGTHTNISLSGLPRTLGDGRIYFEFTPAHIWQLSYVDK